MNGQNCECCKTKERSPEEYKCLIHRLNRIEGQIRGIRGMVERSAYCPDILAQVAAANAALNAFSKELLEERGLDTETAVIAVVTNDFHCFRAHMIAQKQGLRTIDVPAELPWWWLTANYYLREAFAVVKTALFD